MQGPSQRASRRCPKLPCHFRQAGRPRAHGHGGPRTRARGWAACIGPGPLHSVGMDVTDGAVTNPRSLAASSRLLRLFLRRATPARGAAAAGIDLPWHAAVRRRTRDCGTWHLPCPPDGDLFGEVLSALHATKSGGGPGSIQLASVSVDAAVAAWRSSGRDLRPSAGRKPALSASAADAREKRKAPASKQLGQPELQPRQFRMAVPYTPALLHDRKLQ